MLRVTGEYRGATRYVVTLKCLNFQLQEYVRLVGSLSAERLKFHRNRDVKQLR